MVMQRNEQFDAHALEEAKGAIVQGVIKDLQVHHRKHPQKSQGLRIEDSEEYLQRTQNRHNSVTDFSSNQYQHNFLNAVERIPCGVIFQESDVWNEANPHQLKLSLTMGNVNKIRALGVIEISAGWMKPEVDTKYSLPQISAFGAHRLRQGYNELGRHNLRDKVVPSLHEEDQIKYLINMDGSWTNNNAHKITHYAERLVLPIGISPKGRALILYHPDLIRAPRKIEEVIGVKNE